MMHQIYDKLLKEIIKNVPPKFLKLLSGYETGKFLDIQLPSVQMRQPDLLVDVLDGNIVHIEIQSTNDKAITARMYEYSALILKQYGILPLQTLLYIGARPINTTNLLSGRDVAYSYRVVDMKQISCHELLGSKVPDDFILAILCETDDIDGVIKTIVGRLSDLSPVEAKDYCFRLLGLSNLNKIYGKVKKEVENMPITFDIRESEMFLEGKREGKRDGLLEGVEMVLEIKYGATGLELMDMVKKVDTLEKLNQLKVLIKRSDAIDEVRANLMGMLG
ncbi:MAG: hypothetical protein SFH39_05165 [Candidatus Magnetobacterium sp. LHC-1]|nr:hypothetical protein [Nitrospirota bacterium]